MKNNHKGFSIVEGLIVVIVLSIVSLGGYTVWNNNQNKQDSIVEKTENTTTNVNEELDILDTSPDTWSSYNEPPIGFKYPSELVAVDKLNEPGIREFNIALIDFKNSNNEVVFTFQVTETESITTQELLTSIKEAKMEGILLNKDVELFSANGIEAVIYTNLYQGQSSGVAFLHEGKSYSISSYNYGLDRETVTKIASTVFMVQ